jgi:hypothetical protein
MPLNERNFGYFIKAKLDSNISFQKSPKTDYYQTFAPKYSHG